MSVKAKCLQEPKEEASPLADLLGRPFVPADARPQASPPVDDSGNAAIDRLKARVSGTTRGGKLVVMQTWHGCTMTAYVVERRGKGLLVEADGIQAWLPAEKCHVINETEINIPEWLLRRREGEFHIMDCREGNRPRLSWNSVGGDYSES